ncbi:MAG: hypothetical protein ACWGNV_06155 [Bacteroidales bacterium]
MRKLLLLVLFGLSGMACERDDPHARMWPAGELTDGFCIAFGDSVFLNHEDIEYYDFSTHMVYLKEPLSLLEDQFNSEIANMSFTVYALEEPVYTGSLWPAWYSSIPGGPFIQWPSFYPAYLIRIEYMSMVFSTRPDTLSDPRDNPNITEALEKYGQFRNGLSLTIDEISIQRPEKVSFSFSVINGDDVNYYILSPDKMGTGLFHYYTNGLFLYNQETGWLTPQEEVISPEPWDSWDLNWLDLLKAHSSRSYTITYQDFDDIPPGTYDTYFRFPGLYHAAQKEIGLSQGRIWLGEISTGSETTVN